MGNSVDLKSFVLGTGYYSYTCDAERAHGFMRLITDVNSAIPAGFIGTYLATTQDAFTID